MFKLFMTSFLFISFLQSFSQIGIGTTSPVATSALDLTSTTKGLLPPRMTFAQRQSIISPATGLIVWCTDCSTRGGLNFFNGISWVNSSGLEVPGNPTTPLALVSGNTQVTLSFTPPVFTGGSAITSYTVVSSPGGISTTSSSSPIVISGLTAGTTYSFSVFATNMAGNSSSSTSNSVTLPAINGYAACDGSGVFNFVELTSLTGKVWMDRNLGAYRAGTSSSDYMAYGCFYQWGRANDGHASISWNSYTSGTPVNGTTTSLASTNSPTNALFVTNSSSPSDWLSSQDNSLWQYSTSTNNPCPTGFVLPTAAEFAAELAAYSITNTATAFSNGPSGGFKFVTPGSRSGADGTLGNVGIMGSYWTQTINSNGATAYVLASNIASASNNRTNGLSVRCIKGSSTNESISVITYPQSGKVLLQYNSVPDAIDYVIYYKQNSSTTWTIYNDGSSTTPGATVEGLTNGVLYDFKVKVAFSNYFPIYSNVISSTPTTIVGSNVYHQILTTGQSLSMGGITRYTTTPMYNNKMINSDLTALLPLIEPATFGFEGNRETKSSAMANFITNSSINTNGNDYKSIVTLSGWWATAYSGLKRGTIYYDKGLARMNAAKSILQSQGLPYIVSAFTVVHGESNNTSSADVYKGYLEEWQNNLETDSKLITGQTGTIPMFLCQLSSTNNTYGNPRVAIGQLAAAEANPTKIYLVTPKYIFDYDDAVHITGSATRRLGEYYGKVMKKVLIDGDTWKPLSPLTISISANVITVNFNVPVAPLQFDTIKVMSTSNYGFEYFDSTNSATINSVALGSNGTSVLITLSNIPTGSNKKIAYAYTNAILPDYIGGGRYVLGSAKGNLRDSDTTPALYTNSLPNNMGTELNNWCVTFIKDIN